MREMVVREVISMRGIIREGNLRGKFPRIEEMVDLLEQDTGDLSLHQIIIPTAIGTICNHLHWLLAPELMMSCLDEESRGAEYQVDTTASLAIMEATEQALETKENE